MQMTPFHATYMAHELTKIGGRGVDKLAEVLADSAIDLVPHQVDVALFALRSPFSCGVIMGDEVGLGKTIEAGLVNAQKYAEGGRNIQIIVPANLRRQWQNELHGVSRTAKTLDQKVELQEQRGALENKRNELRMKIYEEQDKIEEQREELIEEVRKKMTQNMDGTHLFSIKWGIV